MLVLNVADARKLNGINAQHVGDDDVANKWEVVNGDERTLCDDEELKDVLLDLVQSNDSLGMTIELDDSGVRRITLLDGFSFSIVGDKD